MKNIFILLSAIPVLTTSCKKHLSKKNAEAQITATGHYPVIKEYSFTKAFTKDMNTDGNGVTVMIGEEEFKEKQKMIEDFEKKKLVAFTEEPHREEITAWLLGTTIRTWTTVSISLTEEGKKYMIRENNDNYTVRLWETSIDKINGIHETNGGKNAEVYFLISNKNITPFGESFEERNIKTNRTMYFSLFNDGWRINREVFNE
jgi:hypothetical protein